MRTGFTILLVFIFSYESSFCQSKAIDSLKQRLTTTNQDSVRIKILLELAGNFFRSSGPDSALRYDYMALELAKKSNNMVGECHSLLSIGGMYGEAGEFKKADSVYAIASVIAFRLKDKNLLALTYHNTGGVAALKNDFKNAFNKYDTALQYYKELGNKRGIAAILRNFAMDYFFQGNYAEAIRYIYMALPYYEEMKNELRVGECYYFIGNAHKEYFNYNESVKFYLQALTIFEKLSKQPDTIFHVQSNIARTLLSVGEVYLLQGNASNALEKYNSALKLFESYRGLEWYSAADVPGGYIGIGRACELYGDSAKTIRDFSKAVVKYQAAEGYYKKALVIAQERKHENKIAEALFYLGKLSIVQGNYAEAEKLLNQALFLANKIQALIIQRESYFRLSKLYEQTGNYYKAFENFKKYILYRDSIFNREAIQKTEALHMQYEFDKKEDSLHQKQFITQTKLDSQQKQKKIYLGGSVLLGLLSLFVFLNFRSQKKINRLADDAHAKEKAELELQSLRAQLNPHFMFNSLNAIQELILKEENEKSQSYLARFAKLLRLLLENADKPFIPLQRELDFLQLYLSLENLRIPDLQFSIDVDKAIDTEKTMIPNMILQPYIENAIWHGLSPKETDKQLKIRIDQSTGFTNYEIEDNGVGRKKAAELKSLYRKEHKSKGMELLSKRFKLLSKEYGSDIETTVTDITSNGDIAGTLVTIKVPSTISINN